MAGRAGGREPAWFYLCYAPLVLWGPLLAVLTVAYGRRRRAVRNVPVPEWGPGPAPARGALPRGGERRSRAPLTRHETSGRPCMGPLIPPSPERCRTSSTLKDNNPIMRAISA
jgi:hypothetical protein